MNALLRICAGIIDLLQFIFFVALLAFQAMTPIGGAAVGGVTGAVICWNMSDGVVNGLMAAAACFSGGGAAGGILSAIAIPLGIVIDITISSTFGVLLILLLWVTGRFYFMPVAMGFAGEMMPGINGFAPFWSILVHRCIQKYKKDNKHAATKSATFNYVNNESTDRAGAYVDAQRLARNRFITQQQPKDVAEPTPTRVPLQTRNFDGIRAANDNTPRTIYAKAA